MAQRVNIEVLNKAAVNVQVQNSNSINVELPTAPRGLGTPFTADKTEIDQFDTVNFSASKSGLTSLFSIKDVGGFINKLGENVSHQFVAPGNFDIALTQADLTQQTSGVQVKRDFIKVNEVPFLLNNDFAQGATAPYSLRLLRAQHSGGLVRVRADDNGTDKGEADVLPRLQPDGSKIIELNSPIENLNSTAQNRLGAPAGCGDKVLADLVDAGGQNFDGFVSKWYGQSGNGNDASNSTASNQPKIVNSGSVVMENGNPTVDFTGTDAYLKVDTLSDNQPFTYFIVSKLNSNVVGDRNDYTMVDGSGTTNFVQIKKTNLTSPDSFILFAGSILSGVSENSNQNLHYGLFNGSNSVMRTNETENTGDVGGNNPKGLTLGARIDGSGQYWEGNIQEFVLYGEDRSLNKTQIETNINNHYSIF